MSIKKIYIVRHGQTNYNKVGIVQGSGVDSDLNEIGKAQANAFFNAYKEVPFDKIYLSSLKRTRQSVQKFIDLNIPYEIHEGLNEICWGSREGEKITAEEDKYYHWVLDQWRSGKVDMPIEGGESPREVQLKQRKVFDLIESKEDEKNILVCMHGRAMRILMCLLLGTDLSDMDRYEHSNLCLYQLEYDGKSYKLLKENDTSHLNTHD